MRPILSIGLIALLLSTAGCANPATKDEVIDASYWTHDFGDGKGEIEGAYGPYFISLDTSNLSGGAWDGIGIHGTHNPASIGTCASEGWYPHAQQRSPHVEVTDRRWYTGNDQGVRAYKKPPPIAK